MRVLRRIFGLCRYGSTESDLSVRTVHKQPSIDCILMRKRLIYFARAVRSGPPELFALLGARKGDSVIPWVAQLREDLRCLWRMSALCSRLADPQ
eukprot:2041731-Pyramimonas_sp.AAC.1